ncbi:hypothetical protein F0562_030824 [Nyssa sinensis]|uniref:Uncharacterized protein n=1 Tax=Nyssa sinensis TaxID=561372 RepID=A0A5J5B0Z3_9ASTE|nr:hypothetical protein F0562_030824 [Nyssa sinensis]
MCHRHWGLLSLQIQAARLKYRHLHPLKLNNTQVRICLGLDSKFRLERAVYLKGVRSKATNAFRVSS